MGLHHHIKPHHHVATWAVVALGIILTASVYTNATLAEESGDFKQNQDHDGPNQQTKEFFGGEVKGKKGSLPAECQKMTGEIKYESQTNSQTNYQNISPESPPTNVPTSQPSISKEEYDKLTPEARQQLQAGMAGVEQSSQYSPPPPNTSYEKMPEADKAQYREAHQQAFQNFETPECRKAMLAQIQDEMKNFYDKMKSGNFTAKLDNMLAVIEKLQTSGLQSLREAGIDTKEIEGLLVPIKADAGELKSFFSEMLAAMDKFFALKDTPDEAFAYMRTGFPHAKMGGMAKVADRMVGNIEKLQKSLETVSKEVETSSSPTTAPKTDRDEPETEVENGQ